MSKSRYRGTVLLALAAVLAGILNYLYSQYRMEEFYPENPEEEMKMLDSLLAIMPEFEQDQQADEAFSIPEKHENESGHYQLKNFNPNTIRKEAWMQMGLPEVAFESLERYRQKGGVFRKAGQVYKIPHLNRDLARRLESLVRLDTGNLRRENSGFGQAVKRKGASGPFNLNLADSLQLKTIFGIGGKTAARILKYREDLGGFVKKAQLYEVWGLDSLVAEELMETSFIAAAPEIRKINPNAAEEDVLCRHPYIRKGLGRLIVRYRKQHPPFTKPEDLLGIRLFRSETLEKLRPYLIFEKVPE